MDSYVLKKKGEPLRKPHQIELPKRVRRIRLVGNILVILAILGLSFAFWPIGSAELGYRLGIIKGEKYSVREPVAENSDPQNETPKTFGEMGDDSPTVLVPKSTNFGIIVEKIGATAPVIPNVDPGNKAVYNAALQKGVAHAKGTSFPGEPGITYLFAHSTLNPWDVPRYNAVFYLLRELQKDDRIIVYYQGRRYDYFVTEKLIVKPNDFSVFERQDNTSTLILQTCDPPGTTWNRLLVVAKLKKDL